MSDEHETIKFRFNDGFKAVRLNTPEAVAQRARGLRSRLQMEGRYEDIDFAADDVQFISIRDAEDNTVLSILIEGSEVHFMTGLSGLCYDDRLASWLKKLATKISEDKPISLFNRIPHPAPSLLRHLQTVVSHRKKDAESQARVRSEIKAQYARLSSVLGFDVERSSAKEPSYESEGSQAGPSFNPS